MQETIHQMQKYIMDCAYFCTCFLDTVLRVLLRCGCEGCLYDMKPHWSDHGTMALSWQTPWCGRCHLIGLFVWKCNCWDFIFFNKFFRLIFWLGNTGDDRIPSAANKLFFSHSWRWPTVLLCQTSLCSPTPPPKTLICLMQWRLSPWRNRAR